LAEGIDLFVDRLIDYLKQETILFPNTTEGKMALVFRDVSTC